MKSISAEPLFQVQNILGEGPLWHRDQGCLYWVDIEAGELIHANADLTGFHKTHFETPISAFGFTKSGGFILASGAGFLAWDGGDAQPTLIWNPLPDRADIRLNDGKVDPAGRFWAGSLDTQQGEGELYRLDPDGSQHILLKKIGISNGLDWSPDRMTMYYTDSSKGTIFAFDFDLESGEIHNPRPFVQVPQDGSGIVPDGLCVDAEGCLWSAQWNGWRVIRYDLQGNPILTVQVPAQRITSCCFGGDRNSQLFITSARTGLNPEELNMQPHAGDVFTVQTDTIGQKTSFMG